MFNFSHLRLFAIVFLALGLCLAIYFPGLNGQVILDDLNNLTPVSEWWHGRALFVDTLLGNTSGRFGRVVSMASFMLNWHFFGDSIFWLKAINVLIHISIGLVVLLLARECFVALDFDDKTCRDLSLFVAAAWLFSPMFVSTTLYIVQRMAQLSALFIFLGMYFYARMRRSQISGFSGVWWCICALFALIAGVFSKENGILLVPLVFVQEITLYRFVGGQAIRRSLIGFFALAVILPLVAAGGYNATCGNCLIGSYDTRNFTLEQRVFTQFQVIPIYVIRLLFPSNAGFGVFQDDFPIATGLLQPISSLLGLISILIAIGAAVWFVLKGKSLVALGVFVFLVGHALESTIFPLELYFEHRNYMPGFGIFMLLASGVKVACDYSKDMARWMPWLAFSWLILLSFIAWNQVQVWKSHSSILLFSQKYHPESLRLNSELAQMYTEAGDYAAAIKMQTNMVMKSPGYYQPGGLVQLAYIYCHAGTAMPENVADSLRFPPDGKFNWPYFTAGVEIIYADIVSRRCSLANLDVFLKRWLVLSSLYNAQNKISAPAWNSLYRGAEMSWWRLRNVGLTRDFLDAMDRFPGFTRSGPRISLLEFDIALAVGDRKKAQIEYNKLLVEKSGLSTSDKSYFESLESAYKQLWVNK